MRYSDAIYCVEMVEAHADSHCITHPGEFTREVCEAMVQQLNDGREWRNPDGSYKMLYRVVEWRRVFIQ